MLDCLLEILATSDISTISSKVAGSKMPNAGECLEIPITSTKSLGIGMGQQIWNNTLVKI